MLQKHNYFQYTSKSHDCCVGNDLVSRSRGAVIPLLPQAISNQVHIRPAWLMEPINQSLASIHLRELVSQMKQVNIFIIKLFMVIPNLFILLRILRKKHTIKLNNNNQHNQNLICTKLRVSYQY